MSWDNWFQIAMMIAGSGAIGIAAKAFFDRHKLKIDGVSVLSDTALEQVKSIRDEVSGYRADMVVLRAEIRSHTAWDKRVVRKLEEQGIEIDPPPEFSIL